MIFGTLRFHLWPQVGQMRLFLVFIVNSSFQVIFFKFATYIPQTKVYMPSNFQHSAVPFLAIWGPSSFFLVCALQPLVSNFAPNIYWTMFLTPVYIHHHLVTFAGTRGPNAFFLVCALQLLVLHGSFPN